MEAGKNEAVAARVQEREHEALVGTGIGKRVVADDTYALDRPFGTCLGGVQPADHILEPRAEDRETFRVGAIDNRRSGQRPRFSACPPHRDGRYEQAQERNAQRNERNQSRNRVGDLTPLKRIRGYPRGHSRVRPLLDSGREQACSRNGSSASPTGNQATV